MKTLSIIFLLSVLFIYTTNSKNLTINRASGEITIDGNENDPAWQNIAFEEMNLHKGEDANKNNTAAFKMVYSEKFIYILVQVHDETLDTSQSINVWEKDCVELHFSMDTTTVSSATIGSNGFFATRKVFGREMNDFKRKGFIAEEQINNNTYTQEWRFSFDSLASNLKDLSKWNKKIFRLECFNSDNDGSGRNSILSWNSNADDSWYNNRHFGFITLGNYSKIKTSSSKPLIIVKDDRISFSEKTDYCLYNIAGIIIKQGHMTQGLNISNLKKGIYIIKANDEYKKFLK